MRVETRSRCLSGFVAVAAIALWSTTAFAQQKTVKQCTEEWRANKAQNQAQGITEKAFVAQCRSGTAAARTAAAPAGQQRTAKECRDEWRANKAQNQAQGITEKAFVAQCRSGTAAAQPSAAPAQATSPATAPTAAPRTTAAPRRNETTA